MISLRDYQEFASNSPFEYFEAGNKGNPLIAMPTGTGKSLVLAGIIKRILMTWSDQKVLVLTHVKELIMNDYDALMKLWPGVRAGIYSAGLNRRDTDCNVTFAGIGSIANRNLFNNTNIILIDEAHLVSPSQSTMYGKVIARIKSHSPHLKVIGTTATIWRLGQGYLTEGKNAIFNDVCCDMTGIKAFNWFIEQGHLAPLIARPMATEFDLSNVRTTAGEFNAKDLGQAVDIEGITEAALDEVVLHGKDRKSWLVFATSIDHAEHINDSLKSRGIRSGIVHSKMKANDRDSVLIASKNGDIKAIVNQNILTTGFDNPNIDLIAILRPTQSSSLWVQMLGRGTRPSAGKTDCLVLDFARNTERLGPINDPLIPKARRKKGGAAPVKLCPECGEYNHSSARVCRCGFEFPKQVNIYVKPSDAELIAPNSKPKEAPEIVTYEVKNTVYNLHQKNGFTSLKVSYFCGLKVFNEYQHFERDGWMRKSAIKWLKKCSAQPAPKLSADIDTASISPPKEIRVHINKKYPEVVSHAF